jgi:hypothetical protein
VVDPRLRQRFPRVGGQLPSENPLRKGGKVFRTLRGILGLVSVEARVNGASASSVLPGRFVVVRCAGVHRLWWLGCSSKSRRDSDVSIVLVDLVQTKMVGPNRHMDIQVQR